MSSAPLGKQKRGVENNLKDLKVCGRAETKK
jgi:hypothetical protein